MATRTRKKTSKASSQKEPLGSYWKPFAWAILGFLVLCLLIEYHKEGGRLAFLRHKIEGVTHSNDLKTFKPEGFEVLGMDISHHQRKIDWKKVKAEKIAFTFIKATEGVTHQDRYFSKHWREAKKHDMLRGAYHFYLPARDAEKQAHNFLERVHLEAGDLPPVLDVEVTNHQSTEEIREGVRIWLELVEEEYGIKPIIYTNYSFYKEHLAGEFDDYPLWVAHYNPAKSDELEDNHWLFWQHTSTGRLKGVSGNADLNVFRGTMEDLYNMCYEPDAF